MFILTEPALYSAQGGSPSGNTMRVRCKEYFQVTCYLDDKPTNDMPEHRLLAAIVLQALRDLRSEEFDIKRDACLWFLNDELHFCSFREIADYLGIFTEIVVVSECYNAIRRFKIPIFDKGDE
jgi:hypothetical protein